MPRLSHNLAEIVRGESVPRDSKKSPRFRGELDRKTIAARKCLDIEFSVKRIAFALGVKERRVNKWKSGEIQIPTERVDDILEEASVFFFEIHPLQDQVAALILEGFRRGRREKRGDTD